MEEIDDRPVKDEAEPYVPKKLYQPLAAWAVFAVLTVAATVFVLVQGQATEDAITTTGRNAQSASSLDSPIQPRDTVTNYEECVAANGMILESYPEQCVTQDGEKSFTRELTPEEQQNL